MRFFIFILEKDEVPGLVSFNHLLVHLVLKLFIVGITHSQKPPGGYVNGNWFCKVIQIFGCYYWILIQFSACFIYILVINVLSSNKKGEIDVSFHKNTDIRTVWLDLLGLNLEIIKHVELLDAVIRMEGMASSRL